jgi:hypothetical protein
MKYSNVQRETKPLPSKIYTLARFVLSFVGMSGSGATFKNQRGLQLFGLVSFKCERDLCLIDRHPTRRAPLKQEVVGPWRQSAKDKGAALSLGAESHARDETITRDRDNGHPTVIAAPCIRKAPSRCELNRFADDRWSLTRHEKQYDGHDNPNKPRTVRWAVQRENIPASKHESNTCLSFLLRVSYSN